MNFLSVLLRFVVFILPISNALALVPDFVDSIFEKTMQLYKPVARDAGGKFVLKAKLSSNLIVATTGLGAQLQKIH